MALFCKFKIRRNLGIVSPDSSEEEIRDYINIVITELKAGAQLVTASEFSDEVWRTQKVSEETSEPATFVRIMLPEAPKNHGEEQILSSAIAVLEGQTIQITHTSEAGQESHIGFTQM